VKSRADFLEKMWFPLQPSLSHAFEFTPGPVDPLKKAITELGYLKGDEEIEPPKSRRRDYEE